MGDEAGDDTSPLLNGCVCKRPKGYCRPVGSALLSQVIERRYRRGWTATEPFPLSV